MRPLEGLFSGSANHRLYVYVTPTKSTLFSIGVVFHKQRCDPRTALAEKGLAVQIPKISSQSGDNMPVPSAPPQETVKRNGAQRQERLRQKWASEGMTQLTERFPTALVPAIKEIARYLRNHPAGQQLDGKLFADLYVQANDLFNPKGQRHM